MSIQKITQSELHSLGVQSLPTRPSSPTLYSGNALSAKELRAAFDRLPTLVAERFNALLLSTGLFDEAEEPKDALADLIATNIYPGHSLSDLMADLQNGSLASYLSVDGQRSLFTVLSEMKEELSRLDAFSVSIEGEGDILSDLTVTERNLVFHKKQSTEELLQRAKDYADAPKGEVAEGETLAVSGDAVKKALDALYETCEPDTVKSRLSNLEKAAEGKLYCLYEQDEQTGDFRTPFAILEKAALSRIGGSTFRGRNIFVEPLIVSFQTETLSVRWDNTERCLVFHGTLTAGEGPLQLCAFRHPITTNKYGQSLYYRSGSVSFGTTPPSLYFAASDATCENIPMQEEDYIKLSFRFSSSQGRFEGLYIEATEDVVFDQYKCNLMLSEDIHPCQYEMAKTTLGELTVPAELEIQGNNIWEGVREDSGKTLTCLIPSTPLYRDVLGFTCRIESDYPFSEKCAAVITYTDTTEKKVTLFKNEVNECFFRPTAPIDYITFYAANTPEESWDYTVRVFDFHMEGYDGSESFSNYLHPYSPPFSYRIPLPEALQDQSAVWVAIDDENSNYYDFERRIFVSAVRRFTLKDLKGCNKVLMEDNHFTYPVTPPADIGTDPCVACALFEYFNTSGDNKELFWLDSRYFHIVSDLFKTPEEWDAFFQNVALDVFYISTEKQQILLPDVDAAASEPILFSVTENARVRFLDKEGKTVPTYARVAYQSTILEDSQ